MKAIFTLRPNWLFCLLISFPAFCFSQDGSPDLSFGSQGKVFLQFPRQSEEAYNVVQQPDGKLIVVGSTSLPPYELDVARLNPDGSLDASFGNNGKLVINDIGIPTGSQGKRVALRSNGEIVIVISGDIGTKHQIVILRLNPDGSVVGSSGKVFAQRSLITNEGLAIAIQPDNKVLIGGTASNGTINEAVIFRVNADGTYDASFSEKKISFGNRDHALRAIRVQKDGKIVLGITAPGAFGYDFTIVRLNPDGSFDNSFNQSGIRMVDIARDDDIMEDLVIQEDCKILVAGFSKRSGDVNFSLARLNSNGSLDNSFDHDGKLDFQAASLNNRAFDVNVQKDGKIIVTGSSYAPGTGNNYSFIKLNYDGSFDKSFGTNGMISYDFGGKGSDEPYDAIIQQDGKIVAAGKAVGMSSFGWLTDGFGVMRLNNTVGREAPFTCNYNNTAQGGYTLVGNAKKISTTPLCFELTTDWLSQIGGVWSDNTTQFFNLNGNYTIAADIYFGARDNGADGVAFVLQPVGITVLGKRGGGLGYMDISPSLVVEFDTYHNDEPWFDVGDPQEDHIGFMKNGSPYHQGPQSGALLPPIPLPVNIEDDQYHHVEFSWDASTKTMKVSFLGNTYSYTGNIVDSLFGGNSNVYFGFTAATGSPLFNVTQNVQRVCNITVITNTFPGGTENGLTALPNPTTGNAYLKLEQELKGNGKVTIVNSSGSTVAQWPVRLYGKGQIIPLDLSNYPKGIYLVQINSASGSVTKKMIRH